VVAKYASETFFAFHIVNAYEESCYNYPDEQEAVSIIADVALYDDLSVLKKYYYENLRSSSSAAHAPANMAPSSRAKLARFRLPKVPAFWRDDKWRWPWSSTSRTLSSLTGRRCADRLWTVPPHLSAETPSIHPALVTKKHRYVYGILNRGLSTFFDGIGKFDCETKQLLVWDKQGHTPGEPIFVPDPHANPMDEDAGTLLTVVLDGFKGTSYLIVLDAKTMQEVGRADTEQAIAFGFHGLLLRG
jgi:torulene dioxygenase